jgi:MFS family permease
VKRNIFYGWWLVVIALLVNAFTSSPVFGGVGVWVDSLEQEFGWSRTQLSIAFSVGQLEASVMGPVIGMLVDRIGSRKVVLIGISIIGIGFILLSFVSTIWMFYLSFAVLMIGASAGGWLPMMTTINNWFNKRRSMAMGFGGLGFSIGSFLLVPALAWLVNPNHYGWQATSLTLGLFFLASAYPVSLLIRNIPEDYGEVPDGFAYLRNEKNGNAIVETQTYDPSYSMRDILKMPAFWIISICHGMSTMLIGTMTVHLILALKDQGISVQTGAWIWGFTLGFSGLCQIFGGWIGDKVPKNLALCFFGWVQAVGVVTATFITSVYYAPIFVVIYGLGFGARMPLGTAIRGEYFGRKAFGKVLGWSMMPMMLLMMMGPVLAGKMYDVYGSYDGAFYLLAAVGFLGSIGFVFAKKPNPEDYPSVEV